MANRKRGEVSVEALGETYIMRLGTNQICELEDDLKMGINQIVERLNDPERMELKFMRALVFHAVIWGKPATKEDAGDLIDAVGMEVIANKVGESFAAAFPDGGDDKNPPVKAG